MSPSPINDNILKLIQNNSIGLNFLIPMLLCLLGFGIARASIAPHYLPQYSVMTCKSIPSGHRPRKLLRVFINKEKFTWIQFDGLFYKISQSEAVKSSSGNLGYVLTARKGRHFIRVIGKKSFQLLQAPLQMGVRNPKNTEVITTSIPLLCRNDLR